MKTPPAGILFAIIIFIFIPLAALAAPISAGNSGPLVVGKNSRVVVMEYEAWFGPNAVTFQGSAAMPRLQSTDMKPVGGGYDSADPAVIEQHVAWMERLGVDAATSEVTNNVSCIFDSEWFVKKYLPNCTPTFRIQNQNIRDNTGNLYPAWSRLGTRLKLIPLLGGIDQDVLVKDRDGKTAFEKEAEYFGALLSKYPDRAVIYQGKPLMVIFLGAAQDPNRSDHPLWLQLRQFLSKHPEISSKYTFKMMAGYIDSQPALWATPGTPHGPVKINPLLGFGVGSTGSILHAPSRYVPTILRITKLVQEWRTLPLRSRRRARTGGGVPSVRARPTVPTMPCGLEKITHTPHSIPSWHTRGSWILFFCGFINSMNSPCPTRDSTPIPTTISSPQICGAVVPCRSFSGRSGSIAMRLGLRA